MTKKFCKSILIILKEMCNRVNCSFDSIDFTSSDWYFNYTWTEEEQDNFKEWLLDYMKNDKYARTELMTIPHNNKKMLKRFVETFMLNYGWRCKYED